VSKRLIVIAIAIVLVLLLFTPGAMSQVIYDGIPSPLPPNVVSQGYECCAVFEFGDNIKFSGNRRSLGTVTLTMSDWAKHSDFPALPAQGWTHPITLNLYNVDHSSPNPAVGALIKTLTQTFVIPWRPEADPTCPGGIAWRASDGKCYNGFAFNIIFDFTSSNVVLPDEIIFGIAFNTSDYGTNPLRSTNPGGGPYDSLNVGLRDTSVFGFSPVGTDVEPNAIFQNNTSPSQYCDNGVGGLDVFRRDNGCWSPYTPAIQFNAAVQRVVPTITECGMITLAALLGVGSVYYLRRRRLSIQ
jgi:hypothetical protein